MMFDERELQVLSIRNSYEYSKELIEYLNIEKNKLTIYFKELLEHYPITYDVRCDMDDKVLTILLYDIRFHDEDNYNMDDLKHTLEYFKLSPFHVNDSTLEVRGYTHYTIARTSPIPYDEAPGLSLTEWLDHELCCNDKDVMFHVRNAETQIFTNLDYNTWSRLLNNLDKLINGVEISNDAIQELKVSLIYLKNDVRCSKYLTDRSKDRMMGHEDRGLLGG